MKQKLNAWIVACLVGCLCLSTAYAVDNALDQQIATLKKQLEELLRQESEAEFKAQPYIFEDWDNYAKQLEIAEKKEVEARKIRGELQKLVKIRQEKAKNEQ